MRRQSSIVFLLILSVLVVCFVGCSSTPEAVPEEAESITQTATEAVDQLPSEDEIDAGLAQLLADTARLLEEMNAARTEAEAAGAADMFPDEFGSVTSDYEALLKAQAENPKGDFRQQIENLRDKYLAMAQLARAQQLRDQIVEASLQDSNAEAFQKGDEAMARAKSLCAEGASGAQLVEQANVAYDSYHAVIASGYSNKCQSQRELAIAAKEKADSLKAEKAAKDEYAIAANVLADGDAAYTSQDYEVAYNSFVEATRLFTEVYDDVFIRRATADEAIRRAKQKVEASAAIAAEADEIAPLADEDAPASGSVDALAGEDTVADEGVDILADENAPARENVAPSAEDADSVTHEEMEVTQ